MPTPRPVLTLDDAWNLAAERGFTPASARNGPSPYVGIELEWLAVDLHEPCRPAALDAVVDAAERCRPLPGGSLLSFEPGGQVELSSPPLPLCFAFDALARDADLLGQALAAAGVGLVALGLEPGPRRERLVRSPRYDAMEAYFDVEGPAGRTMMRSTAGLQVNVDLGDGNGDGEPRWHRAHAVGPVLAAAFANSPFGDDGPTGRRSSRLAVWSAIDPGRTAPADGASRRNGNGNGGGGRRAWADYALAAGVMLVRAADDRHEPVLSPLPFAEWVERGHPLGWPTADDLEYHLTTLFPPVRPRGWLELRMIDALPTPWWRVAAAVTALLVHDDGIADRVARAAAPARGMWREAARDGLTNPVLATAARGCFAAALDVMPTGGADRVTVDATAAFVERYVARGRTPADDRLERWRRTGVTLPAPDNLPPDDLAEVAWI